MFILLHLQFSSKSIVQKQHYKGSYWSHCLLSSNREFTLLGNAMGITCLYKTPTDLNYYTMFICVVVVIDFITLYYLVKQISILLLFVLLIVW